MKRTRYEHAMSFLELLVEKVAPRKGLDRPGTPLGGAVGGLGNQERQSMGRQRMTMAPRQVNEEARGPIRFY